MIISNVVAYFAIGASTAAVLTFFFGSIYARRQSRLDAVIKYFQHSDEKELRECRHRIYEAMPDTVDAKDASETCGLFQFWGLMVKKGILPLWVFNGPSGERVVQLFEKLYTFIQAKRRQVPRYARDFEWLYRRILKKGYAVAGVLPRINDRTSAYPLNRRRTFIFLAVCGALAVASATVGISDNPLGIVLAFLAAAAFILAFVHPWRTARQYGIFFLASVVGFAVFAILHNVFEAMASKAASAGVVHGMLEGLGVVAFLLAIMVCPAAILVGAVGWVITLARKRHGSGGTPNTGA